MPRFEFKTITLLIILIAVITVFSARAFDLQVVNGSISYTNSIKPLVDKSTTQPPRGLILDKNGTVLADNVKVYDLYFKNNLNKKYNLDDLANFKGNSVLKKSIKEITKDIETTIKNNYAEKLLIENLTKDQIKQLKEFDKKNEGYFEFREKYIRRYKYPKEFSHIIGYVSKVSEEDINNGYLPNSLKGNYKLEKMYEEDLKGVDQKVFELSGSQIKQEGIPGNNLHLTLDKDWQLELYKIIGKYAKNLGAAGGSAVIMETSSGKVVSQVSYPGIDTNKFVKGLSESEYKKLLSSRDEPLIDKAIGQAYTPGSIFKLITGFAILESGVVDINTSYYSNRCIKLGRSDFCEYGKNFYGTMNITRALYLSSNLFFCNYLTKLSNEKGLGEFFKAADNLSIGKKTGIDLEGEVEGNFGKLEDKENAFQGEICNMAIGQGKTLVTPVQMANLVAIIKRNGQTVEPRILEFQSSVGGEKLDSKDVSKKDKIKVSKSSFSVIKEGMSGVAYNQQSSVYWYLGGFWQNNLIAKTGSSETVEFINGRVEERVHGWIVGSFSYKNKNYSFAVNLKYGGGGYYATPVMRDFLNYINSR